MISGLQRGVPFTRLTLLADRVLLEAFPPFKDRARKMAETYGVKLTVVPVETSAEAAIGSILPTQRPSISRLCRVCLAVRSIAWLRPSTDGKYPAFRQSASGTCNEGSLSPCRPNWIWGDSRERSRRMCSVFLQEPTPDGLKWRLSGRAACHQHGDGAGYRQSGRASKC